MDTILLKVQLLALQSTEQGNSDTPSLPGGNEAFFHPIWQLLHLWYKIKGQDLGSLLSEKFTGSIC